MRVSLCNEVIRELSFARQCAFARAVGYDVPEIAPFTLAVEPQLFPPSRRAEIRRAAAEEGIAITSLHYLLLAPAGLSITSEDPTQRARTIAVMRALCDLAADLGASLLVHGSPAQRRLEAGVTYCIEPLAAAETGFVNTVEEAAAIVREIAHPALKSMLDCSAAARAETASIADLLRRWLPTGIIAHVHLNDPNRRGPGEGALAFTPILAALLAGNYRGVAAIEPFLYQPDGPTCAARAIGYVRGLMQGLSAG